MMLPETGRRLHSVIVRESRDLARRRVVFVLRTAFAALLGAGIFLALAQFRDAQGGLINLANLSLVTTRAFLVLATWLFLGLGLVFGLSSALSEKRRRTLGLLLLSRLRHGEIVCGKAVALTGLGASMLLAVLPLFAMLGWVGGIDYGWLTISFALVLTFLLLGVMTGLLAGFWRSGLAASLITAALVISVLIAYPLLSDASGVSMATEGLLGASLSISQGIEQTGPILGALWELLGWTLAIALGATLALGRSAAVRRGSGIRDLLERIDRFFERINLGGVRIRGSAAGRFSVARLTRTTGGLARGTHAFRLLAISIALTMLSPTLLALGNWGGWIAWILAVLLAAVPLFLGCGAIAGDRERRTLTPLLTVPLTGPAIVGGKALGALTQFLMIAAAPCLGWIVLARLLNDGDTEAVLAWRWLAFALAGYGFGIAPSLTAPSPLRAGLAGAGLYATAITAGSILFIVAAGVGDKDEGPHGFLVGFSIVVALSIVAALMLMARFGRSFQVETWLVTVVGSAMAGTIAGTFWSSEEGLPGIGTDLVLGLALGLSALSLVLISMTAWQLDRVLGRAP